VRELYLELREAESHKTAFGVDPFSSSDFIRLSLATCLLLAGCGRNVLVSYGLIMESEVLTLPSRFASLL
jgi:hypothetical protein